MRPGGRGRGSTAGAFCSLARRWRIVFEETLMSSAPNEFDELMAAFPDHVRDLALQTRELIVSELPGIEEFVDSKARVVGYGFGRGYKSLVCTIIPSKRELKLGIAYGADLTDPHGLLRGEGKRHRHIPLRATADLRQAGLVELLQARAAET
jgi:hypothetical protein